MASINDIPATLNEELRAEAIERLARQALTVNARAIFRLDTLRDTDGQYRVRVSMPLANEAVAPMVFRVQKDNREQSWNSRIEAEMGMLDALRHYVREKAKCLLESIDACPGEDHSMCRPESKPEHVEVTPPPENADGKLEQNRHDTPIEHFPVR